MFKEAEYFIGGCTSQAILAKYPEVEEQMKRALPVINTVDVLLRLQESYPEAWEMCADAVFPVASPLPRR